MKRFLLLLILLLGLGIFIQPAGATNVMPRYVSTKYTNTIGLYQVSNKITLYKEPSEDSAIIHSFSWSKNRVFPENATFEDLFVVYFPNKDLALMAVTDETEEWVEVIYNNSTGSKGWVKKDDPFKFMTWVNFFNMYGHKYGLYQLQSAPVSTNDIKSSPEDKAKIIGILNNPQKINLNIIRGNYALVSVYDLDRIPKTGFIKWRSDNGVKYFFPDIK